MRTLRVLLSAAILLPAPLAAQETKAQLGNGKQPPALYESKAPAASNGAPKASGTPAASPLPTFSGPSASGISTPPSSGGSGQSEERQQLDKLTATNQIEQQKLAAKLRPVTEEREEVVAKYNLLYEKQKLELVTLEAELKRLQLEGNLDEERFKKEVVALRRQRDKLRLENEVTREKIAAEQAAADLAKLKMDVAMRELDFQSRKLRAEAELAESKTVGLKVDLDLREKKDKLKKAVDRDPDYLKQPFKDGVLTVTDRRITLNGPIIYGVADYVTDRIHYWNNKSSELPIFIVIDRSPGGSVMEGYRILKAMKASKAPVHVVVKSYAASMAATIATLAPHSYAYPNAIILHHQIWSVIFGNPTQQKQQYDVIQDWDKRLREPVAQKMGTSLKKFTDEMYAHNVDGDWEEFADQAVKLKWIDHVVHEIRETGFLKEPEDKKDEKPKLAFGLAEETGAKGERFVRLPQLQPFDAYFLYNRDGYFR
ncbi:MAG: ATP-dependent Clp protease proteolytic subunit [Elusimicrobiota bacterium]|nr:ATP-dependent Clp protease proteolytic subunit [Elusimicrobiota bacterium]